MKDNPLLTDLKLLYLSYKRSLKGIDWKEQVQRNESNILKILKKLQEELRTGTYKTKPMNCFTIKERGKTRYIKAMNFCDRIVLHSLCDYVVFPKIIPKLIYDNGATIKGKGISFTNRRLTEHLIDYKKKHNGFKGYILKIDFSKYFDNIDHIKIKEMFNKYINDEMSLWLIEMFIDMFRVRLGNIDSALFNSLSSDLIPYNSLEWNDDGNPLQILSKSVGIGSQISQCIGVLYANSIDQMCKNVLGHKYYGRYMDDIYILHDNKPFLEYTLKKVEQEAKRLGMFLNFNKTSIKPLEQGFSFLKIRYRFTPTGKILRFSSSATHKRHRRKLRHLKGKLSSRELFMYNKTWNNQYRKYNGFYRQKKFSDSILKD